MWLNQFLLGRPCSEYLFEINPEALSIEESGIVVVQRNLAGDLKKSTLKVSAPTIKVNSSFLSLLQRNQFNSLVGVADTFLSFQTRDDWEQLFDLASTIDSTHFKLQNSSALRLSKALVQAGCSSIITITDIEQVAGGSAGYGGGGFGGGPYGGGGGFDPGVITYDDLTYIVTITNPIPDISMPVYISYVYKGWLVSLDKLGHKAQGGWLDRFTYDFQLTGA